MFLHFPLFLKVIRKESILNEIDLDYQKKKKKGKWRRSETRLGTSQQLEHRPVCPGCVTSLLKAKARVAGQ
jgi:hypothetical protein